MAFDLHRILASVKWRSNEKTTGSRFRCTVFHGQAALVDRTSDEHEFRLMIQQPDGETGSEETDGGRAHTS